jgi:hypothetical protein
MNPYKSCASHLMQEVMWYEYYSSNVNLKPTWTFCWHETHAGLIKPRKQLITNQCIEHRYLSELTVSVNQGDSNGYSKRSS